MKALVLRRGPLSAAIPYFSTGGLKPEIGARISQIRPGCCHVVIVKHRLRADLGRPSLTLCRAAVGILALVFPGRMAGL